MIRSIADFAIAWGVESASTLKVFRALTDASLAQKVTSDGRSLGFLAWHIAGSLREMGEQAGLPVTGPAEQEPAPTSAAVLADAYEKAAASMIPAVTSKWTDAQLDVEIPMFGQSWKRGFVLSALMGHQCHHRGQMTVLMRQAGLVVPGVCGPAKEEWAHFGMAPLP